MRRDEVEHLEIFRKAVQSPYDFVRNKGVVGFVCSYVPEEIILAAGYTPMRLFGTKGVSGKAQRHLQTYACSLVRGILEEGLSHDGGQMAAVVFPDACDSIRRLSDIWRINVKGPAHLDLVLPVKLHTESAEAYTIDVLERFRKELALILNVEISDEDLIESVAVMNKIRIALAQLDGLRASGRLDLKGKDYYTVVQAAMVMDRHEFLHLIGELLGEVVKKEPTHRGWAKVFIVGGMCKIPEIYEAVEEAGGWIVGDDLCAGSRYFSTPCPTDMEPIRAIARRILTRPICPAKHRGIRDRMEHMVNRVKETGAQGVIFVTYKFCDPHAFDYPDLRKKLEEEGYPTLLLEIEDPLPSEGQIRTRCEAFMEMMERG